jgi:hypothetical protein
MDFIERVFHIAPDGGNGLTEWAIVQACGCACLLFAARSARFRSSRSILCGLLSRIWKERKILQGTSSPWGFCSQTRLLNSI